jgi:cytochrome P450
MFLRVARASLLDSLRFNLLHVLPLGLQGTFLKRPFWVRVVGRLHPDPLGLRFVARLKAKYSSAYVDLRMLTRRTRLVLDPTGIGYVLARSPDAYADPPAKHSGMSVFQPDAVTISRQPEWEVRRHFNDLVLSAAVSAPLDEHVLSVVRDEVGRWQARGTGQLVWADLQEIFDRVTLRVIFGDAARDDRPVLEALDSLMRRANRILFRGRDRRTFDALYTGIRRYQELSDPHSLVGVGQRALCDPLLWPDGKLPAPEVVRAEGQVPHWMFAMKDTLTANTASTLALLAVHPEVEHAIRATLVAGPVTAAALHAAALLEGCVQEAMRLWPTTPMLLREAVGGGVLGEYHGPGLQVLIWNAANHRDRDMAPDADRFVPERWTGPGPRVQFNHLSGGRQVCAGKRLALFLAKAVIAELSTRARFSVDHPRLVPGAPLPETFDWFSFQATVTRS